MKTSLELLSEKISVVFEDKFPEGYCNDVKWWGNTSRDNLHATLPDGTAQMQCMDLDVGNACSFRCPHCFRRDARFDVVDRENELTHEEIVGFIREAKELGLKQIKVLGRGEPFQNPRFLEFLEEVSAMGIGVSVFTKGHVIGSDVHARKYNEHRGITTGQQLADRLHELNVSILLGFHSFDKETQEEFAGIDLLSIQSPLKDYVNMRDQALINLVKAGFNEYKEDEATRLAIISSPVKPENIHEIFNMYVWARSRNIYFVTSPTMISGKGIDELMREEGFKSYISELTEIWAQIYVWAIEKNLVPLEKFVEDEVSMYPGSHACNQTATGMYLNLSGQVNMCPGRVDDETIFSKDIRKDGLKATWMKSANYKRAQGDEYNYYCPARDGRSVPLNFYDDIQAKVLEVLA
jgi:hypothetical protein